MTDTLRRCPQANGRTEERRRMPEQQPNHDFPAVDVSLQLDASLGHILDATGPLHADVLQSVQQQLGDIVHSLGIPGRVMLDIGPLPATTGGDTEWMRLRVNDTLCRYPQEVLVSAWSSAAGRTADGKPADIRSQLQAAADAPANLPTLPRLWTLIRSQLQAVAGARAENEAGQVADFLGLASREIISRQPAVLLGPAHVVTYGARLESLAGDRRPNSWPPVTSRLMQILKRVLELRISIADTGVVARVLADSEGAHWEDVVEDLVDALAPYVVELRVPEAYVGRLTTPNEEGKDPLTSANEDMFAELGVAFPPFRLVPSTELKPNSFTFAINHLPALPFVGLEAGECLVNETPERLRQMGIKGREAVNPATQQPAAIVKVAKKQPLEASGLKTWDQTGYCILCLNEALRRNCACFVHQRSVEIQLEQLGQSMPALVEVARVKVPVEKVTRVVRALGSEQVSIRNLRLILERLLDYQYWASDPERYLILDDRLSISDCIQNQYTNDLVSFMRAGLQRQISDKYARGASTLMVYLVDPELEDLIDKKNTDAASDEERQENIITALANELSNLPLTAQTPPILTAIAARTGLRDAIKLTFPRMDVLTYQELRPDLNIQPVGRISLR